MGLTDFVSILTLKENFPTFIFHNQVSGTRWNSILYFDCLDIESYYTILYQNERNSKKK